MASGRFLKNKISLSHRVNALSDGGALIFTWMLGHLDCEGRMRGDAMFVKNIVVPYRKYSVKQVDKWLTQMTTLIKDGQPLIQRYEVDGHQYIFYPGFSGEQGQSRIPGEAPAWKGKEAPSVLPAPSGYEATEQVMPITERAIKNTADILDPQLKEMVEAYEANIGIATPGIFEELKNMSKAYPDGWFKDAVSEASGYNKRSLRYIEKILERWTVEGKGDGTKRAKKQLAKVDNTIEGLRIEE